MSIDYSAIHRHSPFTCGNRLSLGDGAAVNGFRNRRFSSLTAAEPVTGLAPIRNGLLAGITRENSPPRAGIHSRLRWLSSGR